MLSTRRRPRSPTRPLPRPSSPLPYLPHACLQLIFDALSPFPSTASASSTNSAPDALAAVCKRLDEYWHQEHVTIISASSSPSPSSSTAVDPLDVAAALVRFPRAREIRLLFHGRVPFDIGAALAAAGGIRAGQISSIEIAGVHLPKDGVSDISRRCPRLQSLVMSNCSAGVICDGDVEELVTRLASGLVRLWLGSSGKKITDVAGLKMAALTSVTSLDLSSCSLLSDATFSALGVLGKTLTELYLGDTRVSDAGLLCVASMRQLRVLDLGGCNRVTSGVLALLPPSIVTLNVQVTSVVHDGVDGGVFAALPLLTDLDASYAEDLTLWAPLDGIAAQLRCLDVSLSALGDAENAEAALARMGMMRDLNLSYCTGIGDEAVRGVAQICGLESLRMMGCAVSDEGVAVLAKAKFRDCVREVDLSWCRGIIEKGVAFRKLSAAFTREDVTVAVESAVE